MRKFKVSFWFDEDRTNPDKIVYVETDSTEKREITRLALQQVGPYPKSYQCMVESADNVEELHVVQITNSLAVNGNAWYHDRDGELFVVRYNKDAQMYVTCHLLGRTETMGYISPAYCTIINTFESEYKFKERSD